MTLSELALILINLMTSTLTAITGIGGGMILIACMPFFLPNNAIIPIHGISQLSSNLSRAYFGRKHILWRPTCQFAFGALIGALLIGNLVRFIQLDFLPPIIGIYILLNLWSKHFHQLMNRLNHFFFIGFIQTGLGLFVGAPGPLAITILYKYEKDPNRVISTGALMMSIVHSLKIIIFLFIGFQLISHIPLILSMIAASILGSYIGTLFREKIARTLVQKILPYLLTVLALKLILGFIIAKF